jgi:hypothetical protein
VVGVWWPGGAVALAVSAWASFRQASPGEVIDPEAA